VLQQAKPSVTDVCNFIRTAHLQAMFCKKKKSSLDRSLEAFTRVVYFGFSTKTDDEETRKEKSKKATTLIAKLRKSIKDGTTNTVDPEHAKLIRLIKASDESRAPWDVLLREAENEMERWAKQLPGYDFVKETRGFGALGFAQIVAECRNLSAYRTVSKVWKRLGFAPYCGYAMSSWRRSTRRPRQLSAEEWIENPFKPERYALMAQVAQWLWVAQWIGKEKSGIVDANGEPIGKPNGPYGEIYAQRRAATAISHPDWSDGHSHSDAMRIMMKEVIIEVYSRWHKECPYDPSIDRSLLPAETVVVQQNTSVESIDAP
jgi:hypothetical protein